MRCAEVIRELAVPSDERDASALAEHLSGCQSCAIWAEHATRLEELWEATKPREPGVVTWDAMWNHIAGAIDSHAPSHASEVSPVFSPLSQSSSGGRFDGVSVGTVRKSRERGRLLVVAGLIGLAQAAAILLAVGLGWHRTQLDPSAAPFDQVTSSTLNVEIEEGRTVLIRSQASEFAVIDLTPDQLVLGVDDFYVMFNALESMATNPIVAMKE
jgi:hypothetical protein